jgi:hypothetical protein
MVPQNELDERRGFRLVREARKRPGILTLAVFAAITIAGTVTMIYAAGAHEKGLFTSGENSIVLATYTYLAILVGMGLNKSKRRIRVEEELEEVRETFARIEQGVRTIPRRLYPVTR